MGFQSFLIVILFSVAHAKSGCPTSRCDANGVAIQPPFWLQGQTPLNCMSPGFNLSCNTKNISILNLPHDEEFYVSSIYYSEKRVMLYDPNNCLPRRLLHLNLSSSPFKAVSYQKYTFFRCPKGQAVQYGATIIDCMSNTTTDIIAARDDLDPLFLMFCDKIASIPVPVSSGYNDLPDELELTWNDKDCKDCRSTTSPSAHQHHKTHTLIMLSVVLSALVIPSLIFTISCCMCMVARDNSRSQITDTNQNQNQTGGRAAVSLGLDKSTIETYRKITVGESRHIEGPNDVTCTICLGDYAPNETIRFMPECEHCFHVECIDEWLSINNKCPVCRNLQTPV
ncbi:putative RING-H2 finger protein ATL21A isoform X1 [Andrographis paniculata]|uniref:putative RING-H2 finger protein ATL21A isoform X1 n=1 Tax=Andrographis paniculata TaxID=175694 RepID=UPI0021E7DEC4|nr:putative RING-H2 finger protein ATL21A isoform X1 [Andrographis paniculata]